jgi:hypothetical protein
MNDSNLAWVSLTFLKMAPDIYGLILVVYYHRISNGSFSLCHVSSDLFLDCDGLDIPTLWRNKSVIGGLGLALKDFEHQRDPFKA